MLAKIWKKFLLIILIILCVINIAVKLSNIYSFDDALEQIKGSIHAITQKK